MTNLLNELWIELESKQDKQSRKVLRWLNKDLLNNIVLDGAVFWFETNMTTSMPNYIYEYLKQWGINKGYKYLYDLKQKGE